MELESAASKKQSAAGLGLEDWREMLSAAGQPAFRAEQVADWIFQKRVVAFSEMTNLSRSLRERLDAEFVLCDLETVLVQGSDDSTRKFLFRCRDGKLIETVLIPASRALFGEGSDRRTLCVSSQVGCAYDCRFCASGLAGFSRNLSASEMVSQVLSVERETGEKVDNLVFMGMGEPLANLTNLTQALKILNAPWGLNIGARRITVSTSGLAPQIEKLAKVPMQIRLAVSLHGATDSVRESIMPVNRNYPLDRLFASLHKWRQEKGQKITFEYILIEDVNDSVEQAEILAKRCRNVRAKVNLIPYNSVDGLPWSRPDEVRQKQFLDVLLKDGIQATLRREKGHDIEAACGQLRLREENLD